MDELTKLVNGELDNDCPFCPDLQKINDTLLLEVTGLNKQIDEQAEQITAIKSTALVDERHKRIDAEAENQRLKELLKVAKMCIYDVKTGTIDIHLISHVWTELDEELAAQPQGGSDE